jgi:hypothetical protein
MSNSTMTDLPEVFESGALVTFIYRDDSYENEQRVTGTLVDADQDAVTITDEENPARRLQVDRATGRLTSITDSRTKEIGDIDVVRFNGPSDYSRTDAITAVMAAREDGLLQTAGIFKWYDPAEVPD